MKGHARLSRRAGVLTLIHKSPFHMPDDNRVSANLSPEAIAEIRGAIRVIHGQLPFLLSLTSQERKEMAKLGDKSVGFDEKCVAYMASHPEFTPGFVEPAEVAKDRSLRSQILEFSAELNTLNQAVDDTLMVLGSELWMADLAYYQSVREAARRGRGGADSIYQDLRQRFPGGGGPSGPAPAPPAKG